ncbi:hypothetical protein Leryth_017962 [Lithospermum erythrorhizon]|nr:hypothetical protein Leryth_017962 [Lithospermum erythrorhizon]
MGSESFNNSLAIVVSEQNLLETNVINGVQCIGFYSQEGYESCLEGAKKFSLYCEKHLPSWLKRARNGKSRIISKEVFLELLTDCHSREQKMHLHQACELFYKLFRSIQSSRNPVPREVQFQWALSEASKHDGVKEHLQRLVSNEKQRLERIFGLGGIENGRDSLSIDKPVRDLITNDVDHESSNILRCKICSEKFVDDRVLGFHWMENHKKEAQWLFRGYVCSICLDSFTNKKVLEMHVQDRHCVQYVDECMLFQCIPCGGHFGNSEELWSHVVSDHVDKFRLENASQLVNGSIGEDSFQKVEAGNSAVVDLMVPENSSGIRRFTCRLCGLKFDLLPDLGRHHQAAHMPPNSDGSHLPKKGTRFYAYKLKTGRLSRPKFKKGLGSSSYRIRNTNALSLKKRVQASNSVVNMENAVQPNLPEASGLGSLVDSQCSAIAKKLFSEIKRTKPRPNNSDILAIAQSTCCKTHLLATLEAKWHITSTIYPFKGSLHIPSDGSDDQVSADTFPWEGFSYITKSLLDQSLRVELEKHFGLRKSETVGARRAVGESPRWDVRRAKMPLALLYHVYLFDDDYEDAKDIYGKAMHGRFPYDERGRIILEEGYLVYECNQKCSCSKSCPNRVLQNGVQVKLEIFKTEKKGWAVRALEAVLRGTFICEYVGEIINEQEANERRTRYLKYGEAHCHYFYEIDAQVNDISRLIEGQGSYVIDATNYGNVSRYINHSCSPNIVNHQVLVESMECELAHIGLYASRDVSLLYHEYHLLF